MKRHRIMLSLITLDNDYHLEQAAAAEEAATRLDVDLKVLFADGDSIHQSQQVLQFIQAKPEQRPDGIIFEPIGGPALWQAAQAAVDAGIAWAVLNKQVQYVKQLRLISKVPVFIVTNDNLEIGRIQGRQLAALLPNGSSILYIQGPSEGDSCKLRTAGLSETKPANIQIKTMPASWTESSAFNAVKSWLHLFASQQELIDAVAAQNDAMAMGAKKAFQECSMSGSSEHWQNLPFLGVDGVPLTGQAWVRTSVLKATIIAPPLAGHALELLVRGLRTSDVPPEITFLSLDSFPVLHTIKPNEPKKKAAWAG
jgi:ribose transport system substrate-binding protein